MLSKATAPLLSVVATSLRLVRWSWSGGPLACQAVGVTGSYTTRLGSNLGAKPRCIWDQRATYSTRDGSFITASSFRWTIREKLPTKPDEHYADSEPVKTARGQPRTSPQSTHAA